VDSLIKRVEQVLAHGEWLGEGAGAVIGVSGGVDSMVLLHILHALAPAHGWEFVVAHMNHQLRGKEADADERFVRNAAKRLRLPFESVRENVKEFAASRRISIEMAARELRHRFLADTAQKRGVRHVVLAHHADDQVELFFVRLMRGAGSQGLGGMELSVPSPAAKRIYLLRPLLGVWKSELLEFARANGIAFRDDATNDSTRILRNRIRHKLLPFIGKNFESQFDRVVLRSMDLIRDEGDFITEEAVRWRKSARAKRAFSQLHVAVQRRVLQLELLGIGVVPQFDHIEKLREKADAWIAVGPGVMVRRTTHGGIERQAPRAPKGSDGEMMLTLNGGARSVAYGGRLFAWNVAVGAQRIRHISGRESFDADKVGSQIMLRHWRAGDRFQPIGMPGAVKVQDWFVNQKVPRERRHELVVATTAQGEIFWIEEQRIGERFKVARETRRVLEWKWRSALASG
jgi:tRNA(Ile)-lysidine synthase